MVGLEELCQQDDGSRQASDENRDGPSSRITANHLINQDIHTDQQLWHMRCTTRARKPGAALNV
jgi:hypothetical protein